MKQFDPSTAKPQRGKDVEERRTLERKMMAILPIVV